MDNHPYQQELDFAVEAVREGARLARQIQSDQGRQRSIKGDQSPVTVADFAVQAFVARGLQETLPGDPLVAEEDSLLLSDEKVLEPVIESLRAYWPASTPEEVVGWIERGGGEPTHRYWTLDPVDGTKGFLRGEQYVVALALIEQGRRVLGVIGCPNLNADGNSELGGPGSLALAIRGAGAWIQPLDGGERRDLRVSDTRLASEARLLRSVEASHTNLDRMRQIQTQLGVSAEPIRMDSQAKYVVLAAGRGELIFRLLSPKKPEYREKIWDQAAGTLLVEEAGGRVTDLDGRPLDFSTGRQLDNNRGVLASNGHLHQEALSAMLGTTQRV
jgi:3'(2'), 5'-bisphosphate nucleotidase